jgi:hypothetical protein
MAATPDAKIVIDISHLKSLIPRSSHAGRSMMALAASRGNKV